MMKSSFQTKDWANNNYLLSKFAYEKVIRSAVNNNPQQALYNICSN